MRCFRDNRNIYRIWNSYRAKGLLRYPGFFFSVMIYMLKARRHAWDYVHGIIRNGCICDVNPIRYPGVRLYLPEFRSDLIQKLIVRNEAFFEEEELSRLKTDYIAEGSTVCDCGAYIGNHSVFFGKICKARHIYAFEPSEEAFRILTRNIDLNDLTRVISAFEVALGSENGLAELFIRDRNNLGATYTMNSKEGRVPVRRLDDMIPSDEKVDFIKIDVEGAEYELLEGAERILINDCPAIFIEIFPENMNSVNDLLKSYGYTIREKYGNDNYLYCKDTGC